MRGRRRSVLDFPENHVSQMMTMVYLNKTEILSRLDGLTGDERSRLLMSRGMTEDDLDRYLSYSAVYIAEEQQHINQIKHVQAGLLMYVPPLLLILGTVGNVLSFVILRQRLMTRQSTYLYLAALTVADSLVLLVGPLRMWLGQLMHADVKLQSQGLCKVVVFLGYTTSDISVWLIIAVTVERYIVVCHPLQANRMCNIPRAQKVIILMILCLSAFNLHFFWTVELTNGSSEHMLSGIENAQLFCGGGNEFRQLVEDMWPWVDAAVYSFIPFFMITVLNCLIIRRVTQAYKSRCLMQKRNTTNCRSGSARSESNTKMTAMLLTVSFAFLITTLPMNVCLIVSALWRQRTDPVAVARFTLAETITTLLMYTNHSMNFFLYCATGQKFRQQLLQLVCAKTAQHLSFSGGTHQSLRPVSPPSRGSTLFHDDPNLRENYGKTTYV